MNDAINKTTRDAVRAARTGAALFDLSDRGKLKIVGRDRAEWLHGMVSNDVSGLEPGEGNYGTILTDRGKVLSDYRLLVCGDGLRLDTEPGAQTALIDRLNRFIISEDAEIVDETAEKRIWGVAGPRSKAVLEEAFGSAVPEVPLYGSFCVGAGFAARQNRAGELGYDIWVPASEGGEAGRRLEEAGARRIDGAALETLRIEAGIARYGVDFDESVIPLEAQLGHAIHWEKGCYVGQEIVARMHYRGHPNKLLVGLRFGEGPAPAVGADLYREAGDAKRSGWVTSAAHSPTLGAWIGLGYVRAKMSDLGTEYALRLESGGVQEAVVSSTPFVDVGAAKTT